MASATVSDALSQVSGAADKGPAYEQLIVNLKSISSLSTIEADLKAVLDSAFGAALGIVATRSVLTTFLSTLKDVSLEPSSQHPDLCIAVGAPTLAHIANDSSFVEQAAILRDLLASAHEANEDFDDAAKMLAEIPLDTSQRKASDDEKVKVWIRIVRNFLEVDDSTSAETYLNKLKNVIHNVDDRELKLHFSLSQARIYDSKRDFLNASSQYHDISMAPVLAEEERLHTLSMAIKCAILAPAGPKRSRTLGRLYKDERCSQLPEHGILEKMFLDRLLSKEEVDSFAQGLAPHQLATTSDGSTVLAKAVIEHNLLAVSRLYANITFANLGLRLGLDADKAEDTTARMIEQGRLVGRIDQIDGIIYFEKGEASGEKGSGRAEVLVGKEMRKWDSNVQGVADEVENITNMLQQELPEWSAKQKLVA